MNEDVRSFFRAWKRNFLGLMLFVLMIVAVIAVIGLCVLLILVIGHFLGILAGSITALICFVGCMSGMLSLAYRFQ